MNSISVSVMACNERNMSCITMSEIFNLHTLCRCCHRDGIFKSLQLPYVHETRIEVYSTMLEETFNITISLPPLDASYAICDHCILKLRDASLFKQLVLVNEQKFEEYCKNEQYDFTLEDNTSIAEARPVQKTTSVSIVHTLKNNNEHLIDEESRNIKAKLVKRHNVQKTKLDANFETLIKTEDGKNYRCTICGKDYNTLKSLRYHITRNHKEAYKCSVCSTICGNRVKYLAHVKDHSALAATCQNQKADPRKRDLQAHLTQHVKGTKFQCDLCKKFFGYKQSLRRHINWHYGVNGCRFVCDLCGHSFSDVTNMNIHIRTVHEKLRPFECSVCPKTFTRKKHLNGHMSRHTGKWSFNCDVCHKGFSCSWKLKQHKLRKHECDIDGNKHERKRGYICKICQLIFETRGKLLTHMGSHVGVEIKKFKCHICGREFMYKYTLNRHIDRHNGVQPFGCGLCNKRFTLKYQLLRHNYNIHRSNSPVSSLKVKVKCDLCNRHFRDIDKHLQSHKERPHACELCTKSYPEKSGLNRHIKSTHFKPRPFSCDRCNQNYIKVRHLKLHMEKVHKINLKFNKQNES